MAKYPKITTEDLAGTGHVGQPDTPNLSTGEMQALFDSRPNKIIDKYNELVDLLNENVGNAIQSEGITNLRLTQNGFEVSSDGGKTWGAAGSEITVNASAKDITMTGYAVASTYSPISATDKLNTVIGKLEAGVADNKQRVAKSIEIVSFNSSTGELVTRTMR